MNATAEITVGADGKPVEPQNGIGTSPNEPDEDAFINQRVLSHYKAGEQIMRFFAFGHLKPEQRAVSRGWAVKALEVCDTLPRCAERAAGLRKLVEAKDCFVRASLPEPTC